MKIRHSIAGKQTLSATLRNWLPLLQCPLNELEANLKEYASINPYVEIESNQETEYIEDDNEPNFDDSSGKYDDYNHFQRFDKKGSQSDSIEAMTIHKETLYERLYRQISDDIFPTPTSKKIAQDVINNLSEDGFFEGDIEKIAQKNSTTPEIVEKIRQRFCMLEPSGIGAIDVKESFLFQLNDHELSNEVYGLLKKMIENMETISDYKKHRDFEEAYAIFKKFKNPPSIEYSPEPQQAIPDIYILEKDGNLEVSLNDQFYPNILIENVTFAKDEPFVKEKLREAKDLIDAMNMRKATLYKIGLILVEFQYDFFKGNEIKPMKLSDISEELGRNTSTISRAVSNKFLACDRGIFSIKSFFSVTVGEDTSAKAIKDYILEIIKSENHQRPLSDQKILEQVQDNFNIKMVRRTITKYREQLNIPTSGERKRSYLLKD
ncbi:MAG: polymerase sigma-54 factor [Campylobacterota bacterium]|nr:polymerase sigma-54 factor [Campylobacterota bacterium]